MATKLCLDINAMNEDFFEESAFIGIVSPEQGYRLCWLINHHFDIGFVRDSEVTITFKKKNGTFYFPVYVHYLSDYGHRYLLYKLKDRNENLLPKTKSIDYLWMVQNTDSTEDAERIMQQLKGIPEVQYIQSFMPEQLADRKNLLI